MRSVCPGCVHEQACGHAEVHACANRVPMIEQERVIAENSLAMPSSGVTAEQAIAKAEVAATAMADGYRAGWSLGYLAALYQTPGCSCEGYRRAVEDARRVEERRRRAREEHHGV